MLKEDMELNFLSSLELEDYLWKVIKDEEIDKDDKLKIVDFLKGYINEDLYAVEYIRDDRIFVLAVEDGEDYKIDDIELYEVKYAPTTKELIQNYFDGELEEDLLMEKLNARTDRQIIDDLKESVGIEGLLNTLDCIETGVEHSPELDTVQTQKSIGYLHSAILEKCDELVEFDIVLHKSIKERMKEMLNAESKIKDLLS